MLCDAHRVSPPAEQVDSPFDPLQCAVALFLLLAIFHQVYWFNAAVYLPPILWWLFFIRPGQGRAVVLWLRKFDITEPKRFPFEVYLATACAGFAVPVTIRDSALPWSAQQAATRMWLRFPLEMVKFVAILMLVMIPFGLVLSSFPSTDRYFAFLSVPPAVFVLVIFIRYMRRQRKARGVFPLDKRDSVDALREFLHSVKSGRSPTAG